MTDIKPEIIEDAKAAAEAKLTEEEFDFAEAVDGRSYAEFDVSVYLDEASVQKYIDSILARHTAEILIAQVGEDATLDQANELLRLQEEHEALVKSLKDKEFTIHIKGIAPEDQLKIRDEAYEKYPIEYEEVPSVYGPPTKQEIENDDRDLYFAMRLRQAHIVWVKDAKGRTDKKFDNLDKVYKIVNRLPEKAREKLDEAIQKSTISVDFYSALASEVF